MSAEGRGGPGGPAGAGAAARVAAISILVRVDTAASHAAPLVEARGRALSPRDRDFLRALVKTTLRNRSLLDHVLERKLSRTLASLDPAVRAALRLGGAQLLFMGGVPARAAVAATVEAAKSEAPRGAGLVNAVLRRVAEERAGQAGGASGLVRLPAGAGDDARIAFETSHPLWLVKRWISLLGAERAGAAFAADQRDAPVDLLLDPGAGEAAGVEGALREAGVECAPSPWGPLVRTVTAGNPVASPLVASGRVGVVDAAAQALASLVAKSDVVVDLAAAPGGKTRAILALGLARRVIALDRSPSRLARLSRNLVAAGRRGDVRLVLADAAQPPLSRGAFASLLLDAPCSGTGTLRKNPEIRWRLAEAELEGFAARQRALLAAAADLLAPGGRLVYVTCSLEPEENEGVVGRVVSAREELSVEPLEPGSAPFPAGAATFRAGGAILPPGETNDGFTAFVLRRRA